ncbi:alpha-L-fucosidase [Flavivirga spongiicola]|uniref:alpha-L-fucosidase n=2 Tax=Flavivirga spongiicola TaxID=421621 RepID=A0ABU7XXC3_9FLAO|nr:alpha-L-fucosidase [Flavivirga sp. MEBiC05379]MDO5980188.1 alpha-L-fucosidase [Flavivirga sp. MEBiC05379]
MKSALILLLINIVNNKISAQEVKPLNLNKPEIEQWFTDLGFGMFIHWSMDVQLGMVISHSMVGASEDYLNRYINELPKTFNPENFDAKQWVNAAKLAGMKYIIFTTKHHNGYCMFETKTTDFGIMNSPYGKDVTKMIIDACREAGLAVGIYFSPDDFYFLYTQGTPISRTRKEALASGNPELNEYAKKQIKELMTQYGKIDIVFLDGTDQFSKTELAKLCWEIDPDVMVTRGAINTPEQGSPNNPIPPPWEACITLGHQWQYRPTNETYKTAKDVILKLIDIKAKGGNFLLNFGPDALGDFPTEQMKVLNEVSLWKFINQEAFHQTIPNQKKIKDDNMWFLTSKDRKTVYIFINEDQWRFGERKVFNIEGFSATKKSQISVLGHNGKVLEYQKNVNPAPSVKHTSEGIEISVTRSQRIYNDHKWNNPIVVKLTELDINE